MRIDEKNLDVGQVRLTASDSEDHILCESDARDHSELKGNERHRGMRLKRLNDNADRVPSATNPDHNRLHDLLMKMPDPLNNPLCF
jgi:hypothetical protein